MTRLWQSSWELNSTTVGVEFDSASGTAVTSNVGTGTYAGRTVAAAGQAFFRKHLYASNQSTPVFKRAAPYIGAWPTGGTVTIMRLSDTANDPCAQLAMTTTGTLVLLNESGSQVGSPSGVQAVGSKPVIELGLDPSTNPGTVSARVDGVLFATGANSTQKPWSRLLVGVISIGTADFTWDNWAVNDNTGTAPHNTWPGQGRIVHLLASGAGGSNAWLDTAAAAGTTNNYQLVDETTPDDATTLVQSNTLNAEDWYDLPALGIGPSDTINAVMVGVRYRNNTADAVTAFRTQLRKGASGTVAQSASIVPNTVTWASGNQLVMTADPDGLAWTPASIDVLQVGLKVTASGVNRVQVSSVWVSVDYTPGKTPAGFGSYGALF